MKVRTRVVLVLAMIAALLGITSGAGAQTDAGPTKPAADVERNIVAYEPENAASLRESLKFPEVPPERLLLEANKNASAAEYGEAFLDSELEEIKLRVSLLDESDKVRELTAKYERYGGMYLDHETGQLVINLASSDPKQLGSLQEDLRTSGLFPRGLEDRVVVREVSHSMAELEAARETLREDYGTNAVQATGFIEQDNRIWITLDESEREKGFEESLAPVLRNVPADIPVSVSFGHSMDEDACDARRYCGGGSTRRAGIGIRLDGTNPGEGGCTTGFAFKRSNGDEFLTTAGHCFYDNDSGTVRTWNGTTGLWIGTLNNVNPYKYPDNGYMNCDCRLIQVSDSLTQNVLYKDDSVKWRTITVKHLQSTAGDLVKMFGAGSNGLGSSGVVTETSMDVDGTSGTKCLCWFYETTFANYVRTGGDSGGAVTRNSVHRAVGIHSGENQFVDSNGQTVWRRRYFDVGLMEQPWNLNGEVMLTAN